MVRMARAEEGTSDEVSPFLKNKRVYCQFRIFFSKLIKLPTVLPRKSPNPGTNASALLPHYHCPLLFSPPPSPHPGQPYPIPSPYPPSLCPISFTISIYPLSFTTKHYHHSTLPCPQSQSYNDHTLIKSSPPSPYHHQPTQPNLTYNLPPSPPRTTPCSSSLYTSTPSKRPRETPTLNRDISQLPCAFSFPPLKEPIV